MQTFWKSAKIWQSYKEFEGGNFFETQCKSVMENDDDSTCIIQGESENVALEVFANYS